MHNTKQTIEIADIFRQYGQEFLEQHTLRSIQRKAFYDITHCRTSRLGGHEEACDHCGIIRYAYNSCRNRHCPKCQYIKQVQWVDKLKAKLPPLRYFHLVFTIPAQLHPLFYLNQAKAYHLLFKAAGQALKQAAANPKFLGAQTGAVAVLHTWGQTLTYHPHIHMIVPAGGLSEDGMEWIPSGKKFFLPVKALGKMFRGILCRMLENAAETKQLKLPDNLSSFAQLKPLLYRNPWNVYAKKPLAGPERVIEYLGKYTHRVAISNHRLVACDKGKVIFRCKDAQTGKFTRKVTLEAHEFIRRFMQHVLPSGFYKIRYFGLMALGHVREKIDLCLELLQEEGYFPLYEGLPAIDTFRMVTGQDPLYCPVCKKGKMRCIPPVAREKTEPG